jgi:hypothetical protein
MSRATARNIIILLGLAALVAFVGAAGTVAHVIVTAVSLLFLAGLGWVASIMYRQRHGSLYLMGDRRRGTLYAAVMVLAVTLTATSRLWSTSAGSVAWLVLVGLSVYACFAVVWASRQY